MSNDTNDKQFDEMLGRALKDHRESVPAGFTGRMMSQVELAEQRRVLARVVMQERMALAACLLFGVAVVGVAMLFSAEVSSAFGTVVTRGGGYISGVGESLVGAGQAVKGQSYLLGMVGAVALFGLYGLVDLLFGGRLRLA